MVHPNKQSNNKNERKSNLLKVLTGREKIVVYKTIIDDYLFYNLARTITENISYSNKKKEKK